MGTLPPSRISLLRAAKALTGTLHRYDCHRPSQRGAVVTVRVGMKSNAWLQPFGITQDLSTGRVTGCPSAGFHHHRCRRAVSAVGDGAFSGGTRATATAAKPPTPSATGTATAYCPAIVSGSKSSERARRAICACGTGRSTTAMARRGPRCMTDTLIETATFSVPAARRRRLARSGIPEH